MLLTKLQSSCSPPLGPSRATGLLIIMSFVVVLIGELSAIALWHQKYQRRQTQLTDLQAQLKALAPRRHVPKRPPSTPTTTKQLLRPLPTYTTLDLLQYLSQLSTTDPGINLQEFTGLTTTKQPGFMTQSIRIVLTSSYRDALKLLNQLWQQTPMLELWELQLQSPRGEDFAANLTMMLLLKLTTPLGMEPPLSTPKPTPTIALPQAQVAARIFDNTQLLTYPLSELQLLGTLKQADQIRAIIADPLGNLYQVGLGTKMGLHHDPITALTSDRVVLGAAPQQVIMTLN